MTHPNSAFGMQTRSCNGPTTICERSARAPGRVDAVRRCPSALWINAVEDALGAVVGHYLVSTRGGCFDVSVDVIAGRPVVDEGTGAKTAAGLREVSLVTQATAALHAQEVSQTRTTGKSWA